MYDPNDIDYANYAKEFADREKVDKHLNKKLTIQHREEMRHIQKNQPPPETKEDRITKEIIGAYKKFGIDNANPTRAIMRRSGANVAQATQLVEEC